MATKQSAGILLFRGRDGAPEFLLVHPGGPYWAKRDDGAWSIPKGGIEDEEDPRDTALRELAEELGPAAPDARPGRADRARRDPPEGRQSRRRLGRRGRLRPGRAGQQYIRDGVAAAQRPRSRVPRGRPRRAGSTPRRRGARSSPPRPSCSTACCESPGRPSAPVDVRIARATRLTAARTAATRPDGRRGTPLAARLLGVGARAPERSAAPPGSTRRSRSPTEEAIVAAVESEAVERAIARVLEGPIVEEAVQGALETDAVKRAVLEAMDSEMVDEVWRRLLASDQAQQLVERIAEAPEVRAAIASQGAGLLGDIGRQIVRLARDLDDTAERIAPPGHLPPPPAAADQPRRRRSAAARDGDRRASSSTSPSPSLAGAATLLATLLRRQRRRRPAAARSPPARSSGWRRRRATWSPSGRWPGRTPGMSFLGIRLERAPPAAAALDPPPDRPRPLDDHLRHRLPRHRLRRIAARLGRPHGRHRSRLRRAHAGAGAVVDA